MTEAKFVKRKMPVMPEGVCDFCCADLIGPEVVSYRAVDYISHVAEDAEGPLNASEGDWAACPTCEKLIDAGDWAALTKHCADQFEKQHGGSLLMGRKMLELLIEELHAEFNRARL